MGIKTICRLTDDSDIIIKRDCFFRYSVQIKRFSIKNGTVVPNGWPAHMKDSYSDLSWYKTKDIIWESIHQGLNVPSHCVEYFDYQHLPGRIWCWLRALFH